MSLKWAEGLITSRREADRRLGESIVRGFLARHPYRGGRVLPWDSHSTPMRTSLLVCMWQLTRADWLRPHIHAHATVLERTNVGYGNHDTMQSLALLAAGCALGVPGWKRTAKTRLDADAARSIDAEGALEEQAPGYAPFIWRLFVEAGQHLRACGMDPPPGLKDRLPLVDEFVAHATLPNGSLVPLGDTQPVKPSAIGPLSTWAASRKGGRPLRDTIAVFQRGYVFARDSWTGPTMHCTIRFGPGRYMHGHDDHLSVTYWSQGLEVLTDSGYCRQRSKMRPMRRSKTRPPVRLFQSVAF